MKRGAVECGQGKLKHFTSQGSHDWGVGPNTSHYAPILHEHQVSEELSCVKQGGKSKGKDGGKGFGTWRELETFEFGCLLKRNRCSGVVDDFISL